MGQHTEHSEDLSKAFYVGFYLLLLVLLGVFGDLLVFIVGFLAITTIFAGYFTEKEAEAGHHH